MLQDHLSATLFNSTEDVSEQQNLSDTVLTQSLSVFVVPPRFLS